MRNNPLFLIGEPWVCGSENREADPALLDWDDTVSVLSPFHEVDCHMSCTFRYCFEIQLYPCKFFLKNKQLKMGVSISHNSHRSFRSHSFSVAEFPHHESILPWDQKWENKGHRTLCLKAVNAIPSFLSLPLTVSK